VRVRLEDEAPLADEPRAPREADGDDRVHARGRQATAAGQWTRASPRAETERREVDLTIAFALGALAGLLLFWLLSNR
jgi:hypothetical protein